MLETANPAVLTMLANAPQVVGDAKSIVRKFSEYRVQLAQLVGNVSRLYAATSTLRLRPHPPHPGRTALRPSMRPATCPPG